MEFKPSPAENRQLVRTQYMVPATLLVAFRDDAIDESVTMAELLRQVQPMGAHHPACLPLSHPVPHMRTIRCCWRLTLSASCYSGAPMVCRQHVIMQAAGRLCVAVVELMPDWSTLLNGIQLWREAMPSAAWPMCGEVCRSRTQKLLPAAHSTDKLVDMRCCRAQGLLRSRCRART